MWRALILDDLTPSSSLHRAAPHSTLHNLHSTLYTPHSTLFYTLHTLYTTTFLSHLANEELDYRRQAAQHSTLHPQLARRISPPLPSHLARSDLSPPAHGCGDSPISVTQQSTFRQKAVRGFGHAIRFSQRVDGVHGHHTRFSEVVHDGQWLSRRQTPRVEPSIGAGGSQNGRSEVPR